MQTQTQIFTVQAIIHTTNGDHSYTATLPAQDCDHAAQLISYGIAAAWQGAPFEIISTTELTPDEVQAYRIRL